MEINFFTGAHRPESVVVFNVDVDLKIVLVVVFVADSTMLIIVFDIVSA